MTNPAELAARIKADLTGPGGEFEIVAREIRGHRLDTFAGQRSSLRSWLTDSAACGAREYLVDDRRRLTFADHLAEVRASAAGFAAHGVRPGDRIAILAANSVDWVLAFWAAVYAGATVVAGNAWWTAREIDYALAHTEATLVLADAERASRVTGHEVIALDALPHASSDPAVLPDQDDPAVIMYTSGTTGRPKGAVHSHRNLLAIIEYHRLGDAIQRELATQFGQPWPQRRFLMSLPLFHIASLHNLAIPRLTSGDTVVIDTCRFDADRVLGLIEHEHITNWAVVPTMAHRLAAADTSRYDLSSLSALSVNSAPSSPALKDRLRTALPAIAMALADSYGLTEIGTAATVASSAELAAYPTSVGVPIPTVSVEIRDEDRRCVPDGVDGEIWVRGQFTMLGYWRDEAATDAAITSDGWFRTGDLGRLEDGRLVMAARRSDLILRGGENVYPAEVEAVLDEHPGVLESAVYGVDHAELGQEVAAVVVTDLPEAELADWAAKHLAYYKVPARWRVTADRLPRTATGKVVRRGFT